MLQGKCNIKETSFISVEAWKKALAMFFSVNAYLFTNKDLTSLVTDGYYNFCFFEDTAS